MTVKELASKMNELMREGYGDKLVYFSYDPSVHYPINSIIQQKMGALVEDAIILKSEPVKDGLK